MECEAGVATAVIKLDTLADAVWSATQDDNLLLVGRLRFVSAVLPTLGASWADHRRVTIER